MEKSGEDLHMNFPLTIATCPFRIPNSTQQPVIAYGERLYVTLSTSYLISNISFYIWYIYIWLEPCCDHAEGGVYIGPEFQLGQVYDGTLGIEEGETLLLYRPVYACVKPSASKSSSKRRDGTKNKDVSKGSPPSIKISDADEQQQKRGKKYQREGGRNSVTDSSSDKEVSRRSNEKKKIEGHKRSDREGQRSEEEMRLIKSSADHEQETLKNGDAEQRRKSSTVQIE